MTDTDTGAQSSCEMDDRVSGFLAIEETEDSNHFIHCFFVLEKEKLVYYQEKPENVSAEAQPIGCVNLRLVSNVGCADEIRPRLNNCIVMYSPGKKLYLRAPTHDAMVSWMKELNNACRISVPKTAEEKVMLQQRLSSEESSVAKQLLVRVPSANIANPNADIDSSCDELDVDYEHKESTVIKQGYCVKLGALVKNWKRRWFVLDEYGLRYYKNETALISKKMPLGKIDIQDIRDLRQSIGVYPLRDNLFEVVTFNRVFYIQTDTPTDLQSWMSAIKSCVQKLDGKGSAAENKSEFYRKLPWP